MAQKDKEDTTAAEEAVKAAFPNASEEDWPTQPESAQPPATMPGSNKEIKMAMPAGGVVPFTVEGLKQLTFEQLSSMEVVTAEDTIGEFQFGPILENKQKLCGVPLVILHWEFHDGDMGVFATMYILTQDEQRFIVNDGSTGICEQLRAITQSRGIDSMLVCPGGFRESQYDYTLPSGKVTKASTFYIEAQQRVK